MFKTIAPRAKSLCLKTALFSIAASLVTTGLVLPAGAFPKTESELLSLGDLPGANHSDGRPVTFNSAIPAHMVGFDWVGSPDSGLEVRARYSTGWGPWFHADAAKDEGPDLGRESSAVVRTTSRPVWLGGGVIDLQVKAEGRPLKQARAHIIQSEADKSGMFRPSRASAQTPSPGIISRAGWGADESFRTCGPDYAESVKYSFVHHTASGNTYSADEAAAVVRGIYRYHTKSNGWCDIGYNFLVDRFGRAYEGRYGGITKAVIGAHAGGFNTSSTGIALMGTFQDVQVPAAARSALRSLLAWKLDLHGVDPKAQVYAYSNGSSRYPAGTVVTLWTISGHRDVSTTQCPGDLAYTLLPAIRNDVADDIDYYRWQDLGGELNSGPDVSSWGNNRLDVFALNGDDGISHKYWDGAQWSTWQGVNIIEPVVTQTQSAPTAVSWGPTRLDVFARGVDNGLWHTHSNGTGWAPMESMGGVILHAPDAASWDVGRLDVFAVGSDQALWHRAWNGAAWGTWESLGGRLTSKPAAVSWGPNRIDLFGRGADNQLWHLAWGGRGWSKWEPLGGTLSSGPDVSSWGKDRLDVFAAGSDSAIWHLAWSGSRWERWESLGGQTASDPGAASWGPGRIDVFSRGKDNRLMHKWWNGYGWDG